MKKFSLSILLLTALMTSNNLGAKERNALAKNYSTVSVLYSVPDNAQQNFSDVYFRFGWNAKAPYKIALQFVNRSYSSRKLKFAIKDVTSKKMVVLDATRNTRFGLETLKANSEGALWSGPVDNVKDSFSLRVWNSDGDTLDTEPISIKDQQ